MFDFQHKIKLQPYISKVFEEKMRKSHQDRYEIVQQKPIYKMKIFNGVESKVKQRLLQEKEKLRGKLTNSTSINNFPQNHLESNCTKKIGYNYGSRSINHNLISNNNNKPNINNYDDATDKHIDNLIQQVEDELKIMK